MMLRKLREGEQIEFNDRIKVETALGVQWQTVTRVTRKFAFVRYNEHAEGKFPREYNSFGFCSLPKPKWSTNQYSAWRPLPPPAAPHEQPQQEKP